MRREGRIAMALPPVPGVPTTVPQVLDLIAMADEAPAPYKTDYLAVLRQADFVSIFGTVRAARTFRQMARAFLTD